MSLVADRGLGTISFIFMLGHFTFKHSNLNTYFLIDVLLILRVHVVVLLQDGSHQKP